MSLLLQRQLGKLGLSPGEAPDAAEWRAFLEHVQRTYDEAEQDRYTLERSLMTSSGEMRQLHAELRRSEANFKSLVERLPDAVFVHRDSVLRYANPAMARLLGLGSPAALVGQGARDAFVHPDDRAMLDDFVVRRDAGEDPGPLQIRWVRRDGGVIVVQSVSTAIVFDDEPATLVIAHDITRRLHDEAAVRLSEERYRLLFERNPLPVWLFDPRSLRILAVNDTFTHLYGYSRDELLAMKLTDLKVPEEIPDMVARLRRGADGAAPLADGNRPWRGTKKHRKKDGSLFDIEVTSHAVMADGRPVRLAIGVDVTERRQLEDQLRQSQKMEAIGQLAGGIAHDFNNILAAIQANAEWLVEELGEAHPLAADAATIVAATGRGAALTHQLLAFGRKQTLVPRVLHLNAVVTEMQKLLSRAIGPSIRMTCNLDPNLASVEVDLSQLEQVLLNLVVNARDAMPQGGSLEIRTRNLALTAPRGELGPGAYVQLSVEDTGIGMDDATLARIYEPFFTTKGAGRGTGLGLSTVFGIVRQSGGTIGVRSAPGRGTCFEVHLPARSSPAPSEPVPVARPAGKCRGTILLVDDDESVRAGIGRFLRARGYTVTAAKDGVDGLRLWGADGGPIDLVLTDVIMPGLDGPGMASRMRRTRPDARILYMSGYSGAALDVDPAVDRVLRKPFTSEQLGEAVAEALAPHE
jgi:hypothetical protein